MGLRLIAIVLLSTAVDLTSSSITGAANITAKNTKAASKNPAPKKLAAPPQKVVERLNLSNFDRAVQAENRRDIEEGIRFFTEALTDIKEELKKTLHKTAQKTGHPLTPPSTELKNKEARIYAGLLRARNAKGQMFFFQDEDLEKARKIFDDNRILSQEFLKQFPNRVEAYFAEAVTAGNLALISGPRKKVELAQNIPKTLAMAQKLDSHFPYVPLAYGIFYNEVAHISFLERFFAELLWGEVPQASLADAERQFRRSLELDPSFLLTRFRLAKILLDLDRPKEALIEFHKIIDLPANDYNDDIWKSLSRKQLDELTF